MSIQGNRRTPITLLGSVGDFGSVNPLTYSSIILSTSPDTFVAGQVVKLNTANQQKPLIVEKPTSNTDGLFGFIVYNHVQNTYSVATKKTDVQIMRRGVMWMIASAAINAGADVEVVIASNKIATQSAGTTIGKALYGAAADGDLVPVEINL